MAKFHVKWSSGKELTVEKSDCSTVKEFVNSYFGANADPEAQGTEVTMDGEKPEVDPTPAPVANPKPKTKK